MEKTIIHSSLCNVLLNMWRGVTISFRTGGQGHPTPIHTQTPSPTHRQIQSVENARFATFQLDHHKWMDGPTDQRTDQRTEKVPYRVAFPGQKRYKRCGLNRDQLIPPTYLDFPISHCKKLLTVTALNVSLLVISVNHESFCPVSRPPLHNNRANNCIPMQVWMP